MFRFFNFIFLGALLFSFFTQAETQKINQEAISKKESALPIASPTLTEVATQTTVQSKAQTETQTKKKTQTETPVKAQTKVQTEIPAKKKTQTQKKEPSLSLKNYKQKIILSVGQKRKLKSIPSKTLRIGNKSLVHLAVKGNNLEIIGKKQGQTYIQIHSNYYRVIVTSSKLQKHLSLIEKKLQPLWGLNWDLSQDQKIEITGVLNRMYDWVLIAELAKAHNIPYIFKARLGENLKPTVLNFFQAISKNHSPPDIQWSQLPLALIPESEDLSFYQKTFQAFGLEIQKDKTWFQATPFLKINVALIETSSVSDSLFGKSNKSSTSSMPFLSLLSLLQVLKNKGQGKTIFHSSLLAQSGQALHIQNGGEIPFSQYNSQTEHYSTQWKSYGLDLKVLALVDSKNNIRLDIKGSLSEPVAISVEDSPPPLKTQNIQSIFNVKDKSLLKLFYQEKERRSSFIKGGLSFAAPFISSASKNQNSHKVVQMLLLQVHLLNKEETKDEEKLSRSKLWN